MTDLHVELAGPHGAQAAGRPVLFIHGFASRSDLNWKQSGWVSSFTRDSRPVILVDLPGHGQSTSLVPAPDSATDPYLPRNIVRALDLAARTAGVTAENQMDVIGYSLGARLAWDLLVAQPELVHRAVLGGAPTRNRLAESELAAMLNSPFNADANRERMLALAAAADREPFRPFDPATPKPEQPIAFISGADDALSDPARLAALAPQFEYSLIEGRDHISVLTSRVFKEQSLAFLDR